MNDQTIGIIGLGRMGLAIATRLVAAGYKLVGYDLDANNCLAARDLGVKVVANLKSVGQLTNFVWIMVPEGKPVDDVLNALVTVLPPKSVIVDGGNSFYKDSMSRSLVCAAQEIDFLDCGTSGGVHGKDLGFSLMIGGLHEVFLQHQDIFRAIAAPGGYAHVGGFGAGHYVKMVHNGIEYALLQAYAEGFHLLKEGSYPDIDLHAVADVWEHGSIIRSWILSLARDVLADDQEFIDVSGYIAENKTGAWTAQEAYEVNVPVKLIDDALKVRAWSRQTGGNYATKLVALLRNKFGGHALKKAGDHAKK